MAKGEELVKFVTQRVVRYIDTPSEVRKQERERRKHRRKSEPWSVRWFGLVPMGLSMWASKYKKAPPTESHPRRGQ